MKQKVFISGSAKGIGRGIALAFARAGAELMLHYRSNDSEAETLLSEVKKALTNFSLLLEVKKEALVNFFLPLGEKTANPVHCLACCLAVSQATRTCLAAYLADYPGMGLKRMVFICPQKILPVLGKH